MTRPPQRSRSLWFGLVIAALAGLATALISSQQVRGEHQMGLDDLERRARVLADRVRSSTLAAMTLPEGEIRAALQEHLDGHGRLLGFALFNSEGRLLASGPGTEGFEGALAEPVRRAIDNRAEADALSRGPSGSTHVLATPLLDADGGLRGELVVLHDANYLEDRVTRGILRGVAWTLGVSLCIFAIASGLSWAFFERPLHNLAAWMRRLRFGSTPEAPPPGLPVGKLADESHHLAASFRAARAKEREEAQDIVRSDRAWTRERLRAHAIDALGGHPLVVVSNREPYMHQLRDGQATLVRPASGLVTGLDPVLRACGGLWVAHGAGDADRQTVDAAGCIPVPPGDARYTLKRVWITKEEEQGYYYGFSNEGLWPLCHLTHERPIFRASDWEQYVRANKRFADAVLGEIGSEKAAVLVQDYQMALVPGFLKAARPDLRVGIFWHIPWPNAEVFRICPYRVELLKGMLGADLIGFHLQQHCNNFLGTVDRMVEARLDWDRFAAELKGHTALVRPFPISVQGWSERGVASGEELETQISKLRLQHQLGDAAVGVGVDRIDYTKGIAERFRALDRFFEKNPQHKGRFTFVQLGAPSRTHIPRYRDLVTDLEEMADAINWKHQAEGWKPIHFLVGHHEGATVYPFLKMASVCIVSSLHDGMNLVAKEFVAAQGEGGGRGVLVLSEFAGAARDLPEALIVNPYDIEQFAEAIRQAVEMDEPERGRRMARMALRVEENNIYRWAADFLTSLMRSRETSPEPELAAAKS